MFSGGELLKTDIHSSYQKLFPVVNYSFCRSRHLRGRGGMTSHSEASCQEVDTYILHGSSEQYIKLTTCMAGTIMWLSPVFLITTANTAEILKPDTFNFSGVCGILRVHEL